MSRGWYAHVLTPCGGGLMASQRPSGFIHCTPPTLPPMSNTLPTGTPWHPYSMPAMRTPVPTSQANTATMTPTAGTWSPWPASGSCSTFNTASEQSTKKRKLERTGTWSTPSPVTCCVQCAHAGKAHVCTQNRRTIGCRRCNEQRLGCSFRSGT